MNSWFASPPPFAPGRYQLVAWVALAQRRHIELEVWPQTWHVWHMAAPALLQANEAIMQIGAYVRQRTSNSE
jgi:hypothetical protein